MADIKKVIKGLECCATFKACRASIDCPYKQEGSSFPVCYDRLAKDTLELLKEQQAEIERLKAEKTKAFVQQVCRSFQL